MINDKNWHRERVQIVSAATQETEAKTGSIEFIIDRNRKL